MVAANRKFKLPEPDISEKLVIPKAIQGNGQREDWMDQCGEPCDAMNGVLCCALHAVRTMLHWKCGEHRSLGLSAAVSTWPSHHMRRFRTFSCLKPCHVQKMVGRQTAMIGVAVASLAHAEMAESVHLPESRVHRDSCSLWSPAMLALTDRIKEASQKSRSGGRKRSESPSELLPIV